MGGAGLDTDLVAYFNPGARPNATPAGADVEDEAGNTYPIFLDPLVVRDPDVRQMWTLPMAIRYLCYYENASQQYVTNPDGAAIDALLDSRSPDDGVNFNLADSTTYASEPIEVPDYPATGKVWPNVVEDLLRPNGFGMAFRLETDGDGLPTTSLDLFRLQDSSPAVVKDLYLQPRGSTLDPAQTNMGAARLLRDMAGVANAYSVESQLVRYEASLVLAPGFPIAAADSASAASLAAFSFIRPGVLGDEPRQILASTSSMRRARAIGIGRRRRRSRQVLLPSTRSSKAMIPTTRSRTRGGGAFRWVSCSPSIRIGSPSAPSSRFRPTTLASSRRSGTGQAPGSRSTAGSSCSATGSGSGSMLQIPTAGRSARRPWRTRRTPRASSAGSRHRRPPSARNSR